MSGHNHSHVRQALTCYDIALEIFDLTSVASRHAIVLQNKGNVLTRLGIWRGGAEGMRLLEQAIDCYDRALELSPRDLLPQQHRRLAEGSARAHLELALMKPDRASLLAQAWKVASSGVEAARLLERLAPSLEFRYVNLLKFRQKGHRSCGG